MTIQPCGIGMDRDDKTSPGVETTYAQLWLLCVYMCVCISMSSSYLEDIVAKSCQYLCGE